ncbi:MAG: cytochrome c family protein [Sphingomonas sp.]
MRALYLLIGCSALLAACSGGQSRAPAGNEQASAEALPPAANATDTMDGTAWAQFSGDAAAGQRVFLQCQACHAVEPGANRLGPTLHGVVGRRAGSVSGFGYSQANRSAGITWTPEKLFQYLENPRRVVPGTTMAFAGIGDGQRRADLIAYLATLR